MNQMLKKASTTCAAFVCAASLMFAGTASVWADSEIDETVKNQIESYAEGLTDEIIGLTDEQIEQYMESDDAFTSSAMSAWEGSKDDLGELKEKGEVEIEYSDDEYTATLPVKFDKEDAEFVYVFDKNVIPTSLAVDIQYSFGTTMKNAALNTVMGLGTVFVILIFLIFLISLFKYVPGSGAQQVKKKEETTPAPAPAPVPVAVPVQEETDNSELIAVIAAAIAASEGTTTDGFVVRSIRKINRKKR
ncbi:MAG: OadG family transporter subunit [Eubacteriales bacterium]|nr:OadG family transporter subunit [Eubacteriales bacterium]